MMDEFKNIEILFMAGFGPIVRDHDVSNRLYIDTLGLDFKEEAGGYLHTDKLDGVRFFGLWPLPLVAESCFGKDEWPDDTPIPQAWIEFDVKDVKKASEELKSQGYQLLIENKKEPWGQVVTRLLSPEGLMVGLTYTPWMRDD